MALTEKYSLTLTLPLVARRIFTSMLNSTCSHVISSMAQSLPGSLCLFPLMAWMDDHPPAFAAAQSHLLSSGQEKPLSPLTSLVSNVC